MSDQIKLPGDRGGSEGPQKLKVFAAAPHDGSDGILLNWEEDKGGTKRGLFGTYVEDIVGSMALCDYGLDEPPGPGIWVFEGEFKVTYYRSNHPEDPEEWDTCEHWEGAWREPNADELKRWAKNKPVLTGKIGPTPISPDKPAAVQLPSPIRSDNNWCVCGKHVSECCCGEDHSPPHHPSGRAYDEEDYEQFYK
jgi:hypothetical protein